MNCEKIYKKICDLDTLSKVALINIILIVTYIFLICFLVPSIVDSSIGFSEEYIFSFSTPDHAHLNFLSLFGSLIFSSMILILIRKKDGDEKINIIKNVLSKPEKEVVSILQDVKEITQDSLRHRLDWSRAKISSTLTNMEKRNILQRKRDGKTYIVFLVSKK